MANLVNLFDIINSIFQSILFVFIIEYCLLNINRKKINKKIILILLFNTLFWNRLFGNLSIGIFLNHIILFLIVISSYKENKISALVSCTIVYFLISLNVNIFGNLFFGYLNRISIFNNQEILMISIIYVPQIILGFLILKYKEKIKKIHNQILKINPTIGGIIIINLCMDFISAFYLIFYKNESELLRNLVSMTLTLFLGIIILYFINIDIKSHKILELNKNLYEKNTELTTIQGGYAKEITYMHDLYCMKRIDKIGEKLKDIINKNNVEADFKLNENNTLINNIVKKIKYEDINIIIEDEGSINNAKITEIELYRIISNIVNNAVKAMGKTGILIIKTYDIKDYVVIIIENNGPKIEEENICKIFEPGFTTKNNTENNHGYGLSIVKELIEKCGGNINLTSNDISTKFEIRLPLND